MSKASYVFDKDGREINIFAIIQFVNLKYTGPVPNRSKWIRSENRNRTGSVFCLHRTVWNRSRCPERIQLDPILDLLICGSEFWIRFRAGTRTVSCKHLDRFQTVPCEQKPIQSGSVLNGSGPFPCERSLKGK